MINARGSLRRGLDLWPCEYCGHENKEESVVCENCGTIRVDSDYFNDNQDSEDLFFDDEYL